MRTFKATDGNTAAINEYSSIAEAEAACADGPLKRRSNTHMRNDHRDVPHGGLSWYGVEGIPEVRRVMREGHTDAAAIVDTLYDKLSATLPRAVDYRRKRVRSDQGDALDIHAVNRGALDKAWETVSRRANMGTGLLRIVVDICGNANMQARSLQWRGCAALALARVMQRAGYSVEMVAGLCTAEFASGAPHYGVNLITVKPRYASIDTATLAASACFPGFFRWLGFMAIEKLADDCGADVSSLLGHAVALESILPAPDKVMQIITPPINNEQQAVEWLKRAVGLFQQATMASETA